MFTAIAAFALGFATAIGGVMWLQTKWPKFCVLLLCGSCSAATITATPSTPLVLAGQTIDAAGSTVAVKILRGARARITDCDITGSTAFGVDCEGELHLEGSRIHGPMHLVRFLGAARGTVTNNEFSDWLHYAVSVEGTADAGPVVTVDGNYFHDPRPGFDAKGRAARQMIVANNPLGVTNIFDFRATNNRCIGPGEPHSKTDPASRGTGDQISLHHCERFALIGNTSIGGGEIGVAISLNCRKGVVSNHLVGDNDGHGIQVGTMNATDEPDCTDVLVSANVVTNNGVGKDGQTSLAGVYLQDAERVTVTANHINDDEGRQRYGINVAECDMLAISGNSISGTLPAFESIRINQTRTLHIGRHYGIEGPATIASSADPIVQVDEDGVTIDGLKLLGQFHANKRQRGVYSGTAKRGTISGCEFSGMTNAIKLEMTADDWTITDFRMAEIVGVDDGFGYGVLVGESGGHRIGPGIVTGKPGRLRHGVYLSAGASRCRVADVSVDGANSSSFAQYAKAEQQPCVGNTWENCTALNQKRGQADCAAFEITGLCRDTVIRNCTATTIAAHGIIHNTLGLDADGLTIEGFRGEGIEDNGIFFVGARKVRMLDSVVKAVRADVDIHPWWRSNPKRRAEDIEISRNRIKGVTINPTLPKPKNVVVDGVQVAP